MSETIAAGSLPVAALVALLAGFVSFASPCVLPLVPGFLGYVTGLETGPGAVPLASRRRSRVVLGALLFVLGFSAVFVATVVTASAVSETLVAHQQLLVRAGGAVVVVLALVFLGVGARLGSQRRVAPSWRPAAGLVGAPLLGAVFALGWTPCTGPTLAAILALTAPLSGAGLSASVARGAGLALAYCLGLGLPFLLLAAGWSRAERASAWLRRHLRGVHIAGGLLLLVLGVLMLTGVWVTWTAWVQAHLVGSFETAL